MTRLLTHAHDDEAAPWIEDDHQMAVVTELRRCIKAGWRFLFAADFNAGKRNPGHAKAMGIQAGEPDIRVYLPGERIVHIEMKATKGRTSDPQKDRHAALRDLGHHVYVVQERTPAAAVTRVLEILIHYNANSATEIYVRPEQIAVADKPIRVHNP